MSIRTSFLSLLNQSLCQSYMVASLGRKMAKGTKYISQKMFFPPNQEISFLTLKSGISLKK